MPTRVAQKQRQQTEDEPLMSPDEVCDYLRISKRKLREMVYQGQLRAVTVTPRVRRFRRADVRALAGQEVQGS